MNHSEKYLRNSAKLYFDGFKWCLIAYIRNDSEISTLPKYLQTFAYKSDSKEECIIWCDLRGISLLNDEEFEKVYDEYYRMWTDNYLKVTKRIKSLKKELTDV